MGTKRRPQRKYITTKSLRYWNKLIKSGTFPENITKKGTEQKYLRVKQERWSDISMFCTPILEL